MQYRSTNHTHKLVVGIDFGTTNSLIASVNSKKVVIFSDSDGKKILPSIVHYSQNTTIVGYSAYKKLKQDPHNTIYSVKRLVGRSLKEINKHYPFLPYHFISNKNDIIILKTDQGAKNTIQICCDILKTLIKRVRTSVKPQIIEAVITVPAYFNDIQRAGIKQAAKLAEINVIRLINEPTSAAIAYGLEQLKTHSTIAVYDLGGGTFDISILRLSQGVFEVLSTNGDTSLGGDDFDNLLAQYIQKKMKLTKVPTSQEYCVLMEAATQAKINLSQHESTLISALNWKGKITRYEFNDLIHPLVMRTLQSCQNAIQDAKINIDEISEVIMVGGSTRVPIVYTMVHQFFRRKLLTSINPDEVVSIGAAIHADKLTKNTLKSEILLLDVIPLSLGIETLGGLVEKIIPRNTTIPIEVTQEFTTLRDGQTAISIHVVQGERSQASDCRSLARFSLKGIPPMKAGVARMQLLYRVDENGILFVKAQETNTGLKTTMQINSLYNLNKKKINNILKNAVIYTKNDTDFRLLTEQRIQADRLIHYLKKIMSENKDIKLSYNEHQKIMVSIEEAIVLKNKNNINSVNNSIHNLNRIIQKITSN